MTTSSLLTIIESPFAGNVLHNISYARRCLRHSILLGEIPFASHLLYTQDQVLDDDDPDERKLGMLLGHQYYALAERCAVYVDRGLSPGMVQGLEWATFYNVPITIRTLDPTPIHTLKTTHELLAALDIPSP